MKSCGDCGLPAPDVVERCGFCHALLPPALPQSLRVELEGHGVVVRSGGGRICIARRRGIRWNVVDADGGTLFRLCPYSVSDGRHLAAVGDDALLLGSVHLVDAASIAAVVRDADGELVATAFTDGPTGIHVVGADGDVCGLFSTDRTGAHPAIDALVTTAGQRLGAGLVLALLVTLGLAPTLTSQS